MLSSSKFIVCFFFQWLFLFSVKNKIYDIYLTKQYNLLKDIIRNIPASGIFTLLLTFHSSLFSSYKKFIKVCLCFRCYFNLFCVIPRFTWSVVSSTSSCVTAALPVSTSTTRSNNQR